MSRKINGKVLVAVIAALLSGTSLIALADSPKTGVTQENSQKAPEVRFGNPSMTISSDADQQNYDRQDGGISGVSVNGARVFGTRVSNGAAPRPGTTSSNLILHTGGKPMAITHIYSIYWGTFTAANYSGYQTEVARYLGGVGDSANSLNTLVKQYFSGTAGNTTSFASTSYGPTTYLDPSTPPTSAPTTSSILSEVYKAVVTQAKKTLDPNGLYMVFTSNYPSRANYCAWHGAGSVNGTTFTIAYQPYLGGVAGCTPAGQAGFSSNSSISGMDALANVASHEIYETITDPLLNAWFDANGSEIGDKCAWYFGYYKVNTGYYVQTEWSNNKNGATASGGCASS